MNKYRLKPEAVPFFHERYATSIMPWDSWNKRGVDEKALEKVEDAYLRFGHYSSHTDNSSHLSGWSENDGSTFLFTVVFPSVKYCEHDKFSNGKVMRELMDKIQYQINHFYEQFNGNSEES